MENSPVNTTLACRDGIGDPVKNIDKVLFCVATFTGVQAIHGYLMLPSVTLWVKNMLGLKNSRPQAGTPEVSDCLQSVLNVRLVQVT